MAVGFRESQKQLIAKLLAENKALKEANDSFTLGAKRTIEKNCQMYQENKALKKENEKLGELAALGAEQVLSQHGRSPKDEEIKKLKEENKALKEITDGIMEEEGTEHILGCDAHEKFCQAMCELNYDEKWIGELKDEVKELKKEKGSMVKYLSGNYSEQDQVEQIMKDTYSPEFIEGNTETWQEFGLFD